MKRILFVLTVLIFLAALPVFAEEKVAEEKKPETVKETRICWSVGSTMRTFPADKHPTGEELVKFLNNQPPGPFWTLKSITEPTVNDPKYRVTIEWALAGFPSICEVDAPKPAAKKEEKK
ncbi:hypothetical protein [Candidatus Manganitrophus noduliformans]|uniref:Uncharacterized protein n=1 Tax=Candidatus Manganitrophus noduliformans TaxID=2606439 RepID=A0A7X6DMK6_9BACT|nr:hypothetical protein [Candidatus Manganitrophus noduliformans]NKE69877.1 hypothetical protein [Candidatus Manganitrophus noduliformans]